MDKSRIVGKSDFDKKSRFENKLVGLFFVFFSFVDEVPIQWHSLFEAVSNKIVPEFISWISAENIDFAVFLIFRLRPNIEKITTKNNVSDVLWDQMSPKKGGVNPRIIPHPSHLPESHFYEPRTTLM